jgi:PadR family transcriptional regulator, regulatory protein PadR
MGRISDHGMSTLEYHVLLALASGPLYGYAVKDAVAAESAGTLTPRAGSLYRVIARLMSDSLVKEAAPAGELPPHPGLARRYYALTASGRAELLAETRRIKRAATIAEKRLGVAQGRG